ncbi:hypothetical protein [Streptomyces sp. ISL-11]|uniref:hypothetical protein n=1 Tax=Streptomyces sp. ISL-11 TaxID=2819174 RepID=UPI001BEAAE49|nr:hypothetical protein [Streptomyces sp. ISL-11]MBT2383862.1 hypothetical protein [Streptomyces sp. ISL-11]
MNAPAIEDWASRDLADPAMMNRRVRDVHSHLVRPPAVRVIGVEWLARKGSYTHLPCYPVGKQPAGIAYETRSGMTPTNSAGNVVGLVAPIDGRYRYTIGGNVSPGLQSAGADQVHMMWLDIAVLPSADFNTSSVGNNAFTTGSLSSWTAYSNCGTVTVEVPMRAGEFISCVAHTPDLAGIGWADARFHTTACFQELRWIGEVP